MRERRPSSPPWPCASAPSPGARPTPTSARRSTSSSSTRAARSRSTRGTPLFQVPGERNELRYAPRGVVAVIAPWNFPLAIPIGHGRGRRWRPATRSCSSPPSSRPAAARWSSRRCARPACPPSALGARCPARATPAPRSSRHPRRARRSRSPAPAPVGLDILRAAADVPPGRRHLKRVVAEMGGKNCVIVDADADLDDAVPAIVASAFLYAGQKCSAARARARARGDRRRAARAPRRRRRRSSQVGQARRFGTDVPPVIEREAQERVERYAQLAARRRARRGRARATACPSDGWFVRADASSPTCRADSPRAGRGDLRAAARGRARPRRRRRLRPHRRAAVRAHRRPVLAQPAHGRARRRAARRSATSTSTARSPARWSAASRSAATACRAPARRPAAPTTSCTSSSRRS